MKIIILGAGISGLTLAWHLQKKFSNTLEITILEQANRVGGWIQTKKIDGFLFECGPRSMRTNDVSFIQELALQDQLIQDQLIAAHKDAKNKYLALDNQLEMVPSNFLALLTTRLGRKCLKGLLRYPFRWSKTSEDESIQNHFEKRFGKDFTDIFINSLMAGIYAAGPDELSYQAASPSFERGRRLFSFKEGMEVLPKTIAKQLKADIKLNTKAICVREKAKSVEVHTENGSLECDFLFSTLTAEQLKNMLPKTDPLSMLLPEVPRSSVAMATIGFHEDVLPYAGFGFLVPKQEERNLLGVVFDSKVFPEQNQSYKTRLSVMLGGTRAPELLSLPDAALKEMALCFCGKYLGIRKMPDCVHVTRALEAISVYPVGYLNERMRLEEHLRTRKIGMLGAGLYQVALSDCMSLAQKEAERFKLIRL